MAPEEDIDLTLPTPVTRDNRNKKAHVHSMESHGKDCMQSLLHKYIQTPTPEDRQMGGRKKERWEGEEEGKREEEKEDIDPETEAQRATVHVERERERARERQRQRETERDRERQRDRQTDRQTDRQSFKMNITK